MAWWKILAGAYGVIVALIVLASFWIAWRRRDREPVKAIGSASARGFSSDHRAHLDGGDI